MWTHLHKNNNKPTVSAWNGEKERREEDGVSIPPPARSLWEADSDLSVPFHYQGRSCHPIWPEVAAAGARADRDTHTPQSRREAARTQAAIHACMLTHTCLHLASSKCNNPNGSLAAAVTTETGRLHVPQRKMTVALKIQDPWIKIWITVTYTNGWAQLHVYFLKKRTRHLLCQIGLSR